MIASQVGDYILIQELGCGSLGTTFLAEHAFLKRRYVLKLLPEEFTSDPAFLERFEQQIAIVSKLDHPHIAKIHNAARIGNRYFLVMDAVGDGLDLGVYLRKKHQEIAEEEVLRIAHQIGSALDYAHASKCVHGALKLSNICVRQAEEGIDVILTDFGLSKILSPKTAFSRIILEVAGSLDSASDLFCQNYPFLAPEQKKGFSNDDPRSDTYAFGILLYYLLLGEFPEGYFDLPTKRLGELKWNWDLLICKCLQTDPQKRPDQLTSKLDELLTKPSQTARMQLQKLKHVAEDKGTKPLLKPQEIARPAFDADPGAIFQIESAVSTYRPKAQEQKEITPLLTEMAIIPEGTYYRGSNNGARDEMPRHAISLSSFAIDIHPVTNEQFVCFLEAMGGEKDVNNNDIIRLKESRIKRSGGTLTIESGYAKHPVVGVTWYGAIAYTKWIGKRLPTEAEWEIAAYGGKQDLLYPLSNQIEKTQANYFSSDTTPIMSYPPNGYGLYDVVGNVYEWCQDWYDFHYYDISVQEPSNPKGPHQGVYRVLRGGCWKSSKEDLRCAHRHRNNPGVVNGTYGFRCAADVG